jgi:hypothetical protein
MKLPPTTFIARDKLTRYLLRHRDEHDKAGFLALAGYDLSNPEQLDKDMREQLLPHDATSAGTTVYGEKYSIRGTLTGPNGRSLRVFSVWMVEKPAGIAKFITLYADRS